MAYHCLLRLKNNGSCTELKGRVLLYDVFAEEPQCNWNESEICVQREERKRVANYLKEQAERDYVQLSFFQMEKRIRVTQPVTYKNGADLCMSQLAKQCGYPSIKELFVYLKTHYKVDQVIFSFLINKEGRSFAYADEVTGNGRCESLFLFKSNAYTMLHELLHLFGAVDYYFPDEVMKLARRYFPQSVMLARNQFDIDELTRYLIGWHKKPTALAQYVLNAASLITPEAFRKASNEQWNAEYAVVEHVTGVYYGPIKNGLRQGKGKFVFHKGGTYEGEFVDGDFHGQGKYIFDNGIVYEGGFYKGKYDGWGRFIYQNGRVEKCYHERGTRKK